MQAVKVLVRKFQDPDAVDLGTTLLAVHTVLGELLMLGFPNATLDTIQDDPNTLRILSVLPADLIKRLAERLPELLMEFMKLQKLGYPLPMILFILLLKLK